MSAATHRGPVHVLVMAKAPLPGRSKTRLCPPCSPAEAAVIAEAALADTMAAVAACGADHKLVALDGEPGDWLPPGIEVVAQEGDSFDQRLANAWAATRSWTCGWGVQIGMDTPQVGAEDLDDLLALLVAQPMAPWVRRAVLGPAVDGGWWAIGLPGTNPFHVFPGVPLSTATTALAQARRLCSLGLVVIPAPVRRDIDTREDLAHASGAR